jgi:MFS family permease
MVLVDATGSGLFLAGSALFFTRIVGLSSPQVGFGLACAASVALVGTMLWGAVVDVIGTRRVLVVLYLWRAVGSLAYIVVRGFVGFLFVVCFLGLADRATLPVMQTLVGEAVPPAERVKTMAVLRAVKNGGFAIGGLLATIAIGFDTWDAYAALILVDAATFVVAALIGATLPLTHRVPATFLDQRNRSPHPGRDLPYLAIAILNSVLALHITLLKIGIPLWIVQHTRAPRTIIAPLFVVNTVLVLAFQVQASRGASTINGAAKCLRRSGGFLAGCCLLLLTAGYLSSTVAIPVLVLGVMAHTSGELFQAAGGWGLSFELAPEESRGLYLSTFSLGVTAQLVIGPLLLANYVIPQGSAGWVALATLFAVVGAVSGRVIRWAHKTRPHYECSPPMY